MAGAMAGSAILAYREPSDSLRLATLTVNNACNLSCPHCYLQYAGQNAFVADQIVDWVLASSCDHLAIVGKEPLVNRGTAERSWQLLDRAADVGKRVSLITNGLGLRYLPEKAAEVLDYIDVSFDGGPATYQSYRGPSFESLVRQISRFTRRGFTRFRALSVISSATLPAIDDVLTVAELPGIELLVLSPYLPTHNNGMNSVSGVTLQHLLRVLSESQRFRATTNVVLLLAQHEFDLLGWDESQLGIITQSPSLRDRIHFISLDPLELGIVRITYDGHVMTPLQSLHPAEYAHLGMHAPWNDGLTLDDLYDNLRSKVPDYCRHAN